VGALWDAVDYGLKDEPLFLIPFSRSFRYLPPPAEAFHLEETVSNFMHSQAMDKEIVLFTDLPRSSPEPSDSFLEGCVDFTNVSSDGLFSPWGVPPPTPPTLLCPPLRLCWSAWNGFLACPG